MPTLNLPKKSLFLAELLVWPVTAVDILVIDMTLESQIGNKRWVVLPLDKFDRPQVASGFCE